MKIKQQMAALMTATALATISPALADGPAHMTPETMLTLARVGSGALSPDGKLVVYSVGFPNIQDNKIRTEFFTISAQGTDRTQITKAIPGLSSPRWIQQGRRISYLSSESGATQLWTMRPDGSDRRQVTNIEGGISDYLYSPDEKRLAYIKEIKFGKSASDT